MPGCPSPAGCTCRKWGRRSCAASRWCLSHQPCQEAEVRRVWRSRELEDSKRQALMPTEGCTEYSYGDQGSASTKVLVLRWA